MKRFFLILFFILGAAIFLLPNWANASNTKIRFGYFPALYSTPLFVMLEEGWAKEAGIDFELTRFNSLAYLQALSSGEIDGSEGATAAALIMAQENVPIKITATLTNFLTQLVAIGGFREEIATKGLIPALRNFSETHGRKLRLLSIAKGAQPDISIQNWFAENNIDQNNIEFIYSNLDTMQQQVLAGKGDLALVPPPVPSLLRHKGTMADIVLTENDMLAGHSGLVFIFRQEFIDAHPEVVATLSKLISRAIDFIKAHPEKAADYAHQYIGQGLLPKKVIRDALEINPDFFSNDLHANQKFTKKLEVLYRKAGYLDRPISVEKIYDLRFAVE